MEDDDDIVDVMERTRRAMRSAKESPDDLGIDDQFRPVVAKHIQINREAILSLDSNVDVHEERLAEIDTRLDRIERWIIAGAVMMTGGLTDNETEETDNE